MVKPGSVKYLNLAGTGSHKVAVGSFSTDDPAGWLHVRRGDAGAVTPSTSADELVIEDDSTVGMTLMFPDASNGNIYWRSPSATNRALLQYSGANKNLHVGSMEAGGKLTLRSGANVRAVTIDEDQNASFVGSVVLEEDSSPASPAAGSECVVYMKSDKFVIAYNDGGTTKYRSLDLTSTDAAWDYSTTAP